MKKLALIYAFALLISTGLAASPAMAQDSGQRGFQRPDGWLDAAYFDSSGVTIFGWAAQHLFASPLWVHVYVDGVYVGALPADQPRPDVNAATDYVGDLGFGGHFVLAPGRHTVCVYALNYGLLDGQNTPLGCKEGMVGDASPVGWFDEAIIGGCCVVVVRGWAFHPDRTTPVQIHAYVNGEFANGFPADTDRPDVAAVLGVGESHGFDWLVPLWDGEQTVCLYVLSDGPAPHTHPWVAAPGLGIPTSDLVV